LALRIEPLGKQHDRAGFSCGQGELDDWFRRRASQDERRNVARVFVAVDDALGVVGFYSLSSFTLSLENLPDEIARKLPRYDAIPAALIGRLARDEKARGRGIGELLLADALRRILSASKTLAVFAIVVDAKNERAAKFYEAYGFQVFPLQPRRLFLLASSAAAALTKM
jgi:ribosomal protein S18 acetylase RimI-like enzyme